MYNFFSYSRICSQCKVSVILIEVKHEDTVLKLQTHRPQSLSSVSVIHLQSEQMRRLWVTHVGDRHKLLNLFKFVLTSAQLLLTERTVSQDWTN